MRGRPTGQPARWKSRRITSAFLRAAIFLVPLLAGFVVGKSVGSLLPDPENVAGVAIWWSTVIAAATLTATFVDRFSRKMLPLTALLRMTMLFPDRAPSRFQIARGTNSFTELKQRIEAVAAGGDPDLGEMSELVLSLSTALSSHDHQTRGHSERTRLYTDLLAQELGLPEDARDKLRWAALLHDVGKLEVPQDILTKDGGLESAEWETIRQHPVHGMKLVKPLLPWLGEWAKTIEHHHERWDGSGYPYGLRGNAIHPGARIVAVADAYDVMTSGRVYQRPMAPNQARREIAEMAGRQFDPAVARALMSVSLGKLRWSTGPLALIAEMPFIRGLPQFGRDVATIATSSALVATTITAGIISTPVDVSPTDIVRSVVSGELFVSLPTTTLPDQVFLSNQPPDQPAAIPERLPLVNGEAPTIIDPRENQPPVLRTTSGVAFSGILTRLPITVYDPDGDEVLCSMIRFPDTGAASVPADCTAINFRAPDGFTGNVMLMIGLDDGTYLVPFRFDISVLPSSSTTSSSTSTTWPGSPTTTTTRATTTTTTWPGSPTTTTTRATTTTTTQPAATTTTTQPVATTTTTQASTTTAPPTTAAPFAVRDDSFTVFPRAEHWTLDVLANDSSVDPAELRLNGPPPGYGTNLVKFGGVFRLYVYPSYSGPSTLSFVYRVCSATEPVVCANATATVNVVP